MRLLLDALSLRQIHHSRGYLGDCPAIATKLHKHVEMHKRIGSADTTYDGHLTLGRTNAACPSSCRTSQGPTGQTRVK